VVISRKVLDPADGLCVARQRYITSLGFAGQTSSFAHRALNCSLAHNLMAKPLTLWRIMRRAHLTLWLPQACPKSGASAATNSLDRCWNREGPRRNQNASETDGRRRAQGIETAGRIRGRMSSPSLDGPTHQRSLEVNSAACGRSVGSSLDCRYGTSFDHLVGAGEKFESYNRTNDDVSDDEGNYPAFRPLMCGATWRPRHEGRPRFPALSARDGR
jgi:hypothetical protein